MKTPLPLILLGLIAANSISLTAQAQPTSNSPSSQCVGEVFPYIAPANLAMMAYRGYLEKEGIPGYQVLGEQYSFGKVTAQQIVKAAISSCLLSDKYGVASDPNYADDLAMQVQILIQENQ
ncbi:hypothetical protein H6G45_16965 [Synechocystis sp. FACHB-383]|uniref:hypothetical protein n=1 Tax=Synechocystis sp. FACHB-383 TaxID=2692864 RepID=UPI001687A6D1|nr:hypothetical protein [Synechocystis sp. FACHB-383]MBD2655145.1 hypothetical protein [Synechocystis sp. FACHB-383]